MLAALTGERADDECGAAATAAACGAAGGPVPINATALSAVAEGDFSPLGRARRAAVSAAGGRGGGAAALAALAGAALALLL